ncbi:hypothetical protein SAMN05880501_101398 [Ureibacillus xyleni]|uniref:Lipoprotein n=1 Tax=Ureibacillus xyleni TaxID=614648 RepID=A0A285RCM4_9BACL|nr:hypothetical protein [Ureibacillus xyleni]SOB91863.1 hypothetical protein SAMN05880501_101398 [Ureibacillus xyleni]
MKKLLMTIFLSSLILAACNTAEKPTTEPASDSITADSDINNNVEQQQPPITKEEDPQTNNETPAISYTSNNKEFTEATTAVDSEKYTIQTIKGFALTAEEPGKDVLYYEKDDSIFMRIEAASVNDTTFNDLVSNTEETMAAINEQYEPFDFSTYHEDFKLTNSKAFITNFEDEEVLMVVFEKDELLVRLSIYDHAKYDLSDAMIKMGLTIQLK